MTLFSQKSQQMKSSTIIEMDAEKKNICLQWFQDAIDSDYGAATEEYLSSFPFPDKEKHNLTTFKQGIHSGKYSTLNEMLDFFGKEIKYITLILGSNSDVSLFIDGYLNELFKQLKKKVNSFKADQKQMVKNIQENIKILEGLSDKIPDNIEDFGKILDENEQVITMKISSMASVSRSAPIEDVEVLKKDIDNLKIDHRATDIAELIQFYQSPDTYGTENNDDDEIFKMDLSKLSDITLRKIQQYIRQIV